MKKIAVVYTSMGGLIHTMDSLLKQAKPDYQIINIADDSLIREVIANGSVTSDVHTRLMHYFQAAAVMKPEVIISACSSVGGVAEYADKVLDVPVVRIDRAMIEAALAKGDRIGVVASLETTVLPTLDYVSRLAEECGKKAEVYGKTAEGAYEANSRGDTRLHDELITKAASELAPSCDVMILAQGSMARMEEPLRTLLGIPVFSSPALCVKKIAAEY